MENTSGGFVTFGTAHLVAAGVAVGLAVALPLLFRGRAGNASVQQAGRVLAVVLIVHEVFRIALRTGIYGQPLTEHLPLHLCGASLLLGALMLWRRSERLFEIVYFWGIGGSIPALLTPDIQPGFPHPIFVTFFTGHGLVLMGVFYATFVYGFRPTFKSIGMAIGWLVVLAAIVFPVNKLLGTNYLYLMHKPAQASPMDFLGPWPYYILGLAALTFVICVTCWLPFPLSRRLKRKRQP